jgi:hypothetical protein
MKAALLISTLLLAPAVGVAGEQASAAKTEAPAASPAARPSEAEPKPVAEETRPAHPPFVIEERRVDVKHLDAQLRALARQAAHAHKRVLVSFGASWCIACQVIDPVFWREGNRALFRRWELVQVDVDALAEGPVLGIPFDAIPFFMKLDRRGKVVGTLSGSAALGRPPSDANVDAAFARFLGT